MTVPPQWRLFWAVESIGISFALALIAIYYIGDSSPLLEGNNGILQTFPTWFVWGINPASVTLCSVVLSSAMQAVCDLLSEALENAGEPKLDIMVASCFQMLVAAVKRGKERFKLEPCFHVALLMWFGHAVARWATKEQRDDELPVAVFLNPSSPGGEHARLTISDNTSALVYSNVVLVIGLALHALRAFLHRNSHATVTPEPRHSLEAGELGEEGHRHADSRVPSLLVGTGVGYWVSSLLYVLGCSWHGGGCGWNNVPIAVVVISYVVVPLFFVGSIFMVADLNILGTRFGTSVKPVVDMFRDRRTVAFWAIATVFRDFIDVWIGFCRALMSPLLYYV